MQQNIMMQDKQMSLAFPNFYKLEYEILVLFFTMTMCASIFEHFDIY